MEKSPVMYLSQKVNDRLHGLIFSSDDRYVLMRHGCIWLIRFLSIVIHMVIITSLLQDYWNIDDVMNFSGYAIYELGFEILFVYPGIYLLLPFLKKYNNSWLTFAGVALYCILFLSVQYAMSLMSGKHSVGPQNQLLEIWGQLWSFVNFGPFAMAAVFLIAKIARDSFIEIRLKDELVVANAEAELKLLNNQVQPHFLFNALNLIYSYTLKRSASAIDAVRQLYDMMRYMIYDCSSCVVPLDRELEIIDGYIALQNGRFGNRLEMSKAINGRTDGLMIPPQLLLPCVENCYKHGAAVSRGKQWIEMKISVQGRQFELFIRNSRTEMNGHKAGIGLTNLRRRLELIYGNNFKLDIMSSPDTYAVNLQLELEEAPAYNNLQHA